MMMMLIFYGNEVVLDDYDNDDDDDDYDDDDDEEEEGEDDDLDLQLVLLHPGPNHHQLLHKAEDVRPIDDHNDNDDDDDDDDDAMMIVHAHLSYLIFIDPSPKETFLKRKIPLSQNLRGSL